MPTLLIRKPCDGPRQRKFKPAYARPSTAPSGIGSAANANCKGARANLNFGWAKVSTHAQCASHSWWQVPSKDLSLTMEHRLSRACAEAANATLELTSHKGHTASHSARGSVRRPERPMLAQTHNPRRKDAQQAEQTEQSRSRACETVPGSPNSLYRCRTRYC